MSSHQLNLCVHCVPTSLVVTHPGGHRISGLPLRDSELRILASRWKSGFLTRTPCDPCDELSVRNSAGCLSEEVKKSTFQQHLVVSV